MSKRKNHAPSFKAKVADCLLYIFHHFLFSHKFQFVGARDLVASSYPENYL